MSLLTLLLILLLVAVVFGGWGYGYVSPRAPWVGAWSPLGLVLLVLLLLYLTGNLHLH